MTGIVGAGTGVGALLGPLIVSRLVSGYGWRVSYLIVGTVVLAVAVLCAQFIKRDPAKMGQAVYGDHREKRKQVRKQDARELSLSEAVSTAQFWIVFGMVFSLGFCVFAIMVHMVAHVVELGISTLRAASILAMVGGASVIGKVLMGKAVDKIGSRQVFRVGFFLMTVALLALFPTKREWGFYLFAAIFGFAFGGCISSESPIIAELFGLSSHGLILGVVALSFVLGGAVGPLLLGYIFDVTGSYQWGFLACGVISFAGLVLASTLKRRGLPARVGDQD